MKPSALLLVVACFAGLAAADAALAQQRPSRMEVWELRLGTAAEAMPDEFSDYACGTNGGPPSRMLSGWKDFRLWWLLFVVSVLSIYGFFLWFDLSRASR